MTFGPARPNKPFGHRGYTAPASKGSHLNVDGLHRPCVMLMVDDWSTGAHVVVADRLSLALQKQGCEVYIFCNKRTQRTIGSFSTTSTDNPQIICVPDGQETVYFPEMFKAIHPDVLLTEHFPLCDTSKPLAASMLDCVKTAKKIASDQDHKLKVFGLVRDIPSITSISGTCDQALPLFDKLLVRGDPAFYDYKNHFREDWKLLDGKLDYVGYILDNPPHPTHRKQDSQTVVVSLGGGKNGDNIDLYAHLLRAIPFIPQDHPLRHKKWHFVVGDTAQKSELKDVLDYVRGTSQMRAVQTPIELHAFNDQFSSHNFASMLSNADFAVCRGGLTAIEAAASKVPTLVIPRSGSERAEQMLRATALEQSLSARTTVLHPQKGDIDSTYADAFVRAFDKKSRNSSELPFHTQGQTRAADSIILLHNNREPTPLNNGQHR